jgi:zinc/manganese transport system substrate-binding protein
MNRLALIGAAVAALAAPLPAQKLRVVTSTSDLHSIAHTVGGNRISATSIAAGYQDPHFVQAKPSFALQLGRADVFAFVGLDLEIGWMPTLLDAARNARINPGGRGNVDVSRVIPVLDVNPNADRSRGDVHPRGNPHYWLHPENGKRIARLLRDKFAELDPSGVR